MPSIFKIPPVLPLMEWTAKWFVFNEEEMHCVVKVGAVTGITYGRLMGVTVDVKYQERKYCQCVKVNSLSDSPFCQPGDSGSVYYTEDYRRLELLENKILNKSIRYRIKSEAC